MVKRIKKNQSKKRIKGSGLVPFKKGEGWREFIRAENRCNFRDENAKQCENFRIKTDIYCVAHTSRIKPSRTPMPFTLWDFIKKRNLIKKNKPFSIAEYEFLWLLYQDPHPDKVIKKAAQLGITEWACLLSLACCLEIPGFSSIYTMPAKPDCSTLSKQRINSWVRENNKTFTRIKRDGVTYHSKYDSVLEKEIGDSFMFLKGTWMDRQAISTPGDALFHDEVNFCKGDVLGRFSSRIGNSDWRFRFIFSTPTYPEEGVDEHYLKSDQHHYWYKCEHCGFIFKLC